MGYLLHLNYLCADFYMYRCTTSVHVGMYVQYMYMYMHMYMYMS